MKKTLLTFALILISGISLTANAASWVRSVYIVGVQNNCNNEEKVRVFWSDTPNKKYDWSRAICTKDSLDKSLTKSFLTLSQSAMSLGQKVDLELSDYGYLNDIIVRGD